MNRKLLILALLTFTLRLSAESADLRVTKFTTSKSTVAAGEAFTVVMEWHNFGPDTAHGVVATIGTNGDALIITGNGSEHSVCEPAFGGQSFTCSKDLPAGGDAEMIVTMLAPSDARVTQRIAFGTVSATTTDPNQSNNGASASFTLKPAAATSDLSISPSEQETRTSSGEPFSIPLAVHNAGPDAASDLYVTMAFTPGSRIVITANGDGWSCGHPEDAPWNVVCRRPNLAAGASTNLVLHGTTPTAPSGVYQMYARVVAAGGSNDLSSPNLATAIVRVGDVVQTSAWTRYLVPLPTGITPGANGARWTTKTTAILHSTIDVRPDGCEHIVVLCPTPPNFPVNVPFDLAETQLRGEGLGEFVYIRTSDVGQLHINSRVWDASRIAQTAGSEIPIPRDDDFKAGKILLLGIPVAPQYRHTLRVYDLEGKGGAQVAVRIYANGESTPRANTTITLIANPLAFRTTDELLPSNPAALQLDPAQIASLTGVTMMRIEIEPLDAGSHIWAFVSATNNDTHHVTTFSAH